MLACDFVEVLHFGPLAHLFSLLPLQHIQSTHCCLKQGPVSYGHRLSHVAKALSRSPASFRRRPSILGQEVAVAQDVTDLGQRSE